MSSDDPTSAKDETDKVFSTKLIDSLEAIESQTSNASTLVSLLEEVLVEKTSIQKSEDPNASNQLFYDNQYQQFQVQNSVPQIPPSSVPPNNEVPTATNFQNIMPPNMYQYHLYQQQIQQERQLIQRQGNSYDILPENYLFQQQQIFYEMQLQNLYLQHVIQQGINQNDISVARGNDLETNKNTENIEPPKTEKPIDIIEWLSSESVHNMYSPSIDLKEGKLYPEVHFRNSYSIGKSSKKSHDSTEFIPEHKTSKFHPKLKDFTLEKWMLEKLDVCSHISIDKPSPAQYAHRGMFTESKSNFQHLWLSRYAPPLNTGQANDSLNTPASRFRKSCVTEKFEIWDHGLTHVRDMHVSVVPRRVLELSKQADSMKPPILSVKTTKDCRHCIDQRLKDNYLEKLLNLAMHFFLKDFQKMRKILSQETEDKALIVEYDLANLTFFNIEIKPQKGPYQHKIYTFQIAVSYSFPVKPPLVRCLTPIDHPNIKDGEISCNIESQWNKSSTLLGVVKGLISLLENLSFDDSADDAMESNDENNYRRSEYSEVMNKIIVPDNSNSRSYCEKVSIHEMRLQSTDATSNRESKLSFRIPDKPKISFKKKKYSSELFEELYNRTLIENQTPQNEELEMAVQLYRMSKKDDLLDNLIFFNAKSEEADDESEIPQQMRITRDSEAGRRLIQNLNLPDEFYEDDYSNEVMILSNDQDEAHIMRPLIISAKQDNVWLIHPLENRLIRFTLILEHFYLGIESLLDRVISFDSCIRGEICSFMNCFEVMVEFIKHSTLYFCDGNYVPYVRTNIPRVARNTLKFYIPESN